jgi:hypothetical protein
MVDGRVYIGTIAWPEESFNTGSRKGCRVSRKFSVLFRTLRTRTKMRTVPGAN